MLVTLTHLHAAILLAAVLILGVAAVCDVRSYRIPNYLSGGLILLFPAFVATSPVHLPWIYHVAVFALLLAVGTGLFYTRMFGGGDVKLLAATGLWAGPHLVGMLLMATACAGGILSLVFLAKALMHKRGAAEWRKIPVPYGVAIAVGGLAVMSMAAQQPALLAQ